MGTHQVRESSSNAPVTHHTRQSVVHLATTIFQMRRGSVIVIVTVTYHHPRRVFFPFSVCRVYRFGSSWSARHRAHPRRVAAHEVHQGGNASPYRLRPYPMGKRTYSRCHFYSPSITKHMQKGKVWTERVLHFHSRARVVVGDRSDWRGSRCFSFGAPETFSLWYGELANRDHQALMEARQWSTVFHCRWWRVKWRCWIFILGTRVGRPKSSETLIKKTKNSRRVLRIKLGSSRRMPPTHANQLQRKEENSKC